MTTASVSIEKQLCTAARDATITWLREQGLPALPVARYQNPELYPALKKDGNIKRRKDGEIIPLFSGKNPSYHLEDGTPRTIDHNKYQERLPSPKAASHWFAHPETGVGTLGGHQGIYLIDIDRKDFDSQEECDRALDKILSKKPELCDGFLERTQRGGYRLAVKPNKPPKFTNFALESGGRHRGEIIGRGRFAVLSGTIGPDTGKPYENISRGAPVEIESLESIGIYPCKALKEKRYSARPQRSHSYIPGAIRLEDLLTPKCQNILGGGDVQGDRSASLTTLLNEAIGWENWCGHNDVAYQGTAEDLVYYAGQQLEIDAARVGRIVATIDPATCTPACLHRGDETSAWSKVRRLSRSTFEEKCPQYVKDSVQGIFREPPSGGGNGGGGDDDGDSGGGGHSKPDRNRWNAPESWKGELGWWVKKEDENGNPTRMFAAKCNFDFQIERELRSDDGQPGLVLQVKRSFDDEQKRVVIQSLDRLSIKDFTAALTKAFGFDVVCNLKSEHLNSLIHVKLCEYRDRGGKPFLLADRVGRQENDVWVFADRQFSAVGEPITEEESGIVFNHDLISDEDKVGSPPIADPDPQVLPRLVSAMQKFHGESILPAMFMLGFVAAGTHHQTIIKREGRFPLTNAFGDAGCGKTVMAENALSLVGAHKEGSIASTTPSALYERLKRLGSLPQCWDDPRKSPELDELLKGLYNAKERSVRGNTQKPRSPLIITSNHACGDNHPATLSRLIQIPVFKDDSGDRNAWDEMQQAMEGASGALPQLIQLGYPAAKVRATANELRQHLPSAHGRVADSLGLVLWYALEVAKLANFPTEPIREYVINVLCKAANDANSASDSLADFIDKLSALNSQSIVGEWDVRVVETRGMGTVVAVNMPSIWARIDKNFTVPYSRRVIEALIDKVGGEVKGVAKFHRTEDESKAYRRALLADTTCPPKEPEMVSKRCALIPIEIAKDFVGAWTEKDSELHELPQVTSELHKTCNQPNPDSESDSSDEDSQVTFFSENKPQEKALSNVVNSASPSISENSEGGEVCEKNVTCPDLSAETYTNQGEQRLHLSCNSDVTGGNSDVTRSIQVGDSVQWGTSMSHWEVISISGEAALIRSLNQWRVEKEAALSSLRLAEC